MIPFAANGVEGITFTTPALAVISALLAALVTALVTVFRLLIKRHEDELANLFALMKAQESRYDELIAERRIYRGHIVRVLELLEAALNLARKDRGLDPLGGDIVTLRARLEAAADQLEKELPATAPPRKGGPGSGEAQ